MSAVHQPIVLVVEDEPGVRELCCAILRRAGFAAIPACDGIQAMRVCRERSGAIDLLLADVQLGSEPNGIELAEAVLQPGMAIVVMSGTPGMEDLATAKGYPFLAKPFAPAVLVERVRECLADEANAANTTRQPEESFKRGIVNRSNGG